MAFCLIGSASRTNQFELSMDGAEPVPHSQNHFQSLVAVRSQKMKSALSWTSLVPEFS